MNPPAPWKEGACRLNRWERSSSGGFTLLELCTVLFIMVILLGAMMPAMQSIFVEQSLRNDTRQLSFLVRTAMVQSQEQQRDFVVELGAGTMGLHAMILPDAKENQNMVAPSKAPADSSNNDDVSILCSFDPNNKVLVPDPKKADAWIPLRNSSWLFHPGELCPAGPVRVCRGQAWIELNFHPLTGSAEEKATYIP